MKLNDIRDNAGARKKRMIVGRGIGSGKGKTCGRGVKGQKARTGVSVGGFEGGQMPIYRRLPKRGFVNIFAKDYSELNLDRLQSAIEAKKIDITKPLTAEILVEAGIIGASRDGLRLLGKGAIKSKVELTVAGASKTAIDAIEKAGGKVTVIVPKPKKTKEKRAA